jgi:DNA polymerase III delta prime subunit
MIDKYLQQRRKSVYMMEKIWGNVEKNNKKLWEIFLKF